MASPLIYLCGFNVPPRWHSLFGLPYKQTRQSYMTTRQDGLCPTFSNIEGAELLRAPALCALMPISEATICPRRLAPRLASSLPRAICCSAFWGFLAVNSAGCEIRQKPHLFELYRRFVGDMGVSQTALLYFPNPTMQLDWHIKIAPSTIC